MRFLQLEGGNIAIVLFILLVTLFITTRPFITRGMWKKSISIVGLISLLFLSMHYTITEDRIDDVSSAFQNGDDIICESREMRKVANSITINLKQGWRLSGDMFSSDEFERKFHAARCIVK